ncbi:histidine kinase-like ATPase [Phycomyces nitens]|nr:histidine kinase-like ATPase [Phycomyces nitens]
MHPQALSVATTLLHALQPRISRELGRIREEEDLKRAKDAAKLDAENKIRFLADMSHEIRTPMNAVIALTDLLLQERSTLNEEQTEHLEVIQTSGHHLLTVINDILDISKINHDPKFKLESRRFSLRKCVKDALNMARHQASMSQQNKVVSVFECPADMDENMPLSQMLAELERMPLPVHKTKTVLPLLYKIDADVPDHLMGDTMRLTQILLNLCSNAVKFTKKGGIRVGIKLYVPIPSQTVQQSSRMSFKQRYDAKMETIWSIVMGNKQTRRQKDGDARAGASDDESEDCDKVILEISVTDTGIGIPADRLPRLFRSFSQIDISTARRYGGTGLGLAISSTLVNRMGGGLWVESEEGEGSRFALTLPMSIAPTRLKERTPSDSLSTVLTSPPSPSSTVSSRATAGKPHYHHRKSTNSEENLAVQFPIKIMLAEDNVLNQKIAISILKRLGYHDAVIANNGREALDLMRTTKFDVIFASIVCNW